MDTLALGPISTSAPPPTGSGGSPTPLAYIDGGVSPFGWPVLLENYFSPEGPKMPLDPDTAADAIHFTDQDQVEKLEALMFLVDQNNKRDTALAAGLFDAKGATAMRQPHVAVALAQCRRAWTAFQGAQLKAGVVAAVRAGRTAGRRPLTKDVLLELSGQRERDAERRRLQLVQDAVCVAVDLWLRKAAPAQLEASIAAVLATIDGDMDAGALQQMLRAWMAAVPSPAQVAQETQLQPAIERYKVIAATIHGGGRQRCWEWE